MLMFAHGFSIHFGTAAARGRRCDDDRAEGLRHLVRRTYEEGIGTPARRRPAGRDWQGAPASPGLRRRDRAARAGIIETTFKEETETDLFGEQMVLCGGSPS